MGTKSCTKILNFSTRFSCENLAVEDFVMFFMGKKSWSRNVFIGHGFDKLVYASMRGRYKIQSAEGWKWQRIFS